MHMHTLNCSWSSAASLPRDMHASVGHACHGWDRKYLRQDPHSKCCKRQVICSFDCTEDKVSYSFHCDMVYRIAGAEQPSTGADPVGNGECR